MRVIFVMSVVAKVHLVALPQKWLGSPLIVLPCEVVGSVVSRLPYVVEFPFLVISIQQYWLVQLALVSVTSLKSGPPEEGLPDEPEEPDELLQPTNAAKAAKDNKTKSVFFMTNSLVIKLSSIIYIYIYIYIYIVNFAARLLAFQSVPLYRHFPLAVL